VFIYSDQGVPVCVYSENVGKKKRATNVATCMHIRHPSRRVTRQSRHSRPHRTVYARSYRSFLQSLRFDSSLDYSSSLVLTTPRSIERLNMNEEEERFFCAGRWKHARIFAVVHLIFEVTDFFMLIASGFSSTRARWDPFWLSSVKVSPSTHESVGLALKVTAVVLASRLSCARPAQWGVVANAGVELGIPVTPVIPLYCMTTRSRHERKRVRDAAIGSVVVIGIGCADDHVFARNCDTRAKVVIRGCVRGRRERVRAHPLHIT